MRSERRRSGRKWGRKACVVSGGGRERMGMLFVGSVNVNVDFVLVFVVGMESLGLSVGGGRKESKGMDVEKGSRSAKGVVRRRERS